MSAASAAAISQARASASAHGAAAGGAGGADGANAAAARRERERTSTAVDDDATVAPVQDTLPFQAVVREHYEQQASTIAVALFIFANFVISAVEKQINPEAGTRAAVVISAFEIFFAVVFGLELVINLYANWFTYFWKSAWNVFDVVIVTVTFVSMGNPNLPGVTVLRLFRAFRVFRLFKRVESLRIIIEGVGASLPGVGNAFVLLGLLMGIWAIIGVEFFSEYADDEFGNFLKAMFTMWQVMTMDGWASNLARPLLYDDGLTVAAPFFISFTFIAGIVMTNVVVAILLEKYLTATADAQEARVKERAVRMARRRARRTSQTGDGGSAMDDGESAYDDGSLSVSSRGRQRERKLEKDDLVSMLIESLDRKHLASLSQEELVTLAALLWHHPALRDFVPEEMKAHEPPRSAQLPDGVARGTRPPPVSKGSSMCAASAKGGGGAAASVSILLNLMRRTYPPTSLTVTPASGGNGGANGTAGATLTLALPPHAPPPDSTWARAPDTGAAEPEARAEAEASLAEAESQIEHALARSPGQPGALAAG